MISRRICVTSLLVCLLSGISASASPSVSGSSPTTPWVAFGPDGGDARRIVPDPHDPSHLYLGTATGWIYESHNGGGNWVRLAQLGKRDDLVLDSIIVDAKNPRHLVVGTWVIDRPDGGLYLSNDGGVTWTVQAEMRGQSILSMAASPSDPRIMVAGTMRGIFRTKDGGLHWARISPEDNNEIRNVQSVAIDPKDPNVIYGGTWHLPWKTISGGEHWESIKQGIIEDSDVFSIIVDPVKSQSVFASACSGIYKSEDGGLEFHKIQGIPTSARRTRRLLQDPNNPDIVFAGTTEGLFRSDDGGTVWNRTTGPEFIVNDVEVDPANSKHVLIATDRGGVLASEDGGDSFQPANNGFSARQIATVKRDERHPETLYVGVVNDKVWGGVFESENGGLNWRQLSDGLAGRDVFALGQAPDGTMIAGTSHGLFRLSDAEKTWYRVENAPAGPGQKDSGPAVPAAAANAPAPVAAKSKRPIAAKGKTPVKGKAVAAKGKPGAKPVHAVVVAKAATPAVPGPVRTFDGSVYAIATSQHTVIATTSAGLLTSQDDGVTWAATGPQLSADWRFLASAKRFVVAASLHSMSISPDSGMTWNAVRLPEGMTQIATVAVEPRGEMWVGGREGIYVSSDNGATWTVPKNLFLTSVNNIFFDERSDRLTITTSGNSSLVFSVQLPERQVSFTDTGWNLRFVRPMDDHLVGATLYDGIVMQPRMVVSPLETEKAAVQGAPAASRTEAAKQ